MNLQKHDSQTEMEMDMTPMIDVVFLLIIFFMVITDLTQQDLEELKLPLAQNATPDKPDPKEWRPILNVNHRGQVIVKREALFDPERDEGPQKYAELEKALLTMARRMKKAPINPGESRMVPDEPLLIRADESTKFKYVQDIMEKCGHQDVSIWKLQLAVSVPEENQ